MIVCVCPNAAIDVTYEVPRLEPGCSHRVTSVRARAGGKGANVVRVAQSLGVDAELVAFRGGAAGDAIAEDLAAAGVPARWIVTAAESRRTVTVVDAARATVFNEPGGPVSADEWAALRAAVASGLDAGSVLVLSGSLPADCPIAAYAELVELARERRVPVLVDAAGEALQRALGAGPDLVKPNAAEAAELVGHPVVSTADAVAAARALQTQGARGALVSRGAGGAVVVDGVGAWAASLPVAVAGNPTGAGDALAAAVAAGMLRGDPWPDVLRRATAVAAAAVREPVAGAVDPAAAAELCSAVEVTEL